MKKGRRWRWSGRKGLAKAGRPKPRRSVPTRRFPGWAGPMLLVALAAAAGYAALGRAYAGRLAAPLAPPSLGRGVLLEVAVFDGVDGVEEFLTEFLPWARSRGAAGWDGPGVEVVEVPGDTLRYAVVWGPFEVAEAGRRVAELESRWSISPRIAP